MLVISKERDYRTSDDAVGNGADTEVRRFL